MTGSTMPNPSRSIKTVRKITSSAPLGGLLGAFGRADGSEAGIHNLKELQKQ
jgi:hypothetical protein